MKAPRTRTGLLSTAIALAVLPASAMAGPYVPPGNSAATQYTEAVPTAGGPTATGKSKHGGNRAPDKVLGTHNTERLDAHGPQGHAAAEVAAETAPATVDVTPVEAEPAPEPAASGQTQSQGSGAHQKTDTGKTGAPAAGQPAAKPAQMPSPSGSSGLGEVIGQATGSSSSGDLGLLLPLLLAGVVAWSVVFLTRRRKRPAG